MRAVEKKLWRKKDEDCELAHDHNMRYAGRANIGTRQFHIRTSLLDINSNGSLKIVISVNVPGLKYKRGFVMDCYT